MGHLGTKVTRRLMKERVVWSCMIWDINNWVRVCQDCTRAKVKMQPTAAIQPQRFSHIHVDLVGPLPTS